MGCFLITIQTVDGKIDSIAHFFAMNFLFLYKKKNKTKNHLQFSFLSKQNKKFFLLN